MCEPIPDPLSLRHAAGVGSFGSNSQDQPAEGEETTPQPASDHQQTTSE